MMTAHEVLRTSTQDNHARVDAAFGRFNLGLQDSYLGFLQAHARAVISIETALAHSPCPLPWRPRAALLREDLSALSGEMPLVATLLPVGAAQLSGMIYVMEGSRLGGSVLAGRVGASLPTSYLSASHQKGEWRALLAAIDACANVEPAEWLDHAVTGAKSAFSLFEDAARWPAVVG